MGIRLSIAFITYNRANELIRAIESCYPINEECEIVIWDNHSSDDNKNQMDEYVSDRPEIKYYYSDDNLGVAGGRNEVWRRCKGEYVFFLDDDAVLKSNFLMKICDYMDAHLSIGAVAVNIYEPETGNYLNTPIHFFKNNHNYVISYVGAAHMIRQSAIKTISLYPEKLSFGSEELYVCLALWGNRYIVEELDGYTVLHMPSKINRQVGKDRDCNFIVNQYLIKKLIYPTIFKPIILIMFYLRLLSNKIEIKEARNRLKNRYNPKEKNTISINSVLWLIFHFGFKNVM